jgi:hypothetical protein
MAASPMRLDRNGLGYRVRRSSVRARPPTASSDHKPAAASIAGSGSDNSVRQTWSSMHGDVPSSLRSAASTGPRSTPWRSLP